MQTPSDRFRYCVEVMRRLLEILLVP